MTPSQLTQKIEIACTEVLKMAPKPEWMKGDLFIHQRGRGFKTQLQKIIKTVAEKHGVDPDRIKKIIFKE